jgi:hypothetical protein
VIGLMATANLRALLWDQHSALGGHLYHIRHFDGICSPTKSIISERRRLNKSSQTKDADEGRYSWYK